MWLNVGTHYEVTRKFLESYPVTLTVSPSQCTLDPDYGERKPWRVALEYEDRVYAIDPWYGTVFSRPPTVEEVVYYIITDIVQYSPQPLDEYLQGPLNIHLTREQHIQDWQKWQDHCDAVFVFFRLTREELIPIWNAIWDQVWP